MAIFRRNRTWWTDFSLNGQRFRQSLGTTDWRHAQSKEKELIAQASQGKLSIKAQQFARLNFLEASERYLTDRLPNLAPRSIETERERLKPLRAYFGSIPVSRISSDMLRAYIADRKKAGVANKTVNLELGVIRGVLKRAKRWHLISDEIKPLPVRHQIGWALTPEQKVGLTRVSNLKPEWQNAHLAMTLALNTTMRASELKALCWMDIDFLERTVAIRHSKTDAGRRVIPLNADAWQAVTELYQRAQNLGGTDSHHYVFPACENGHVNPTAPQKSWRSAWRSLRKAAGLRRVRFHDLRHHAITELAESQTSDQTIMSIAGHVSREMLDHYSHVRLDAKRRAVEALSQSGKAGCYVTNQVTNGINGDVTQAVTDRKDWSGREDLNLRPPGSEAAPVSLSY